jgi:hypothetical protein
MLTIEPKRSLLPVVDFQSRPMPVIHEAAVVIRNTNRLIDIPRLFTNRMRKASARP